MYFFTWADFLYLVLPTCHQEAPYCKSNKLVGSAPLLQSLLHLSQGSITENTSRQSKTFPIFSFPHSSLLQHLSLLLLEIKLQHSFGYRLRSPWLFNLVFYYTPLTQSTTSVTFQDLFSQVPVQIWGASLTVVHSVNVCMSNHSKEEERFSLATALSLMCDVFVDIYNPPSLSFCLSSMLKFCFLRLGGTVGVGCHLTCYALLV